MERQSNDIPKKVIITVRVSEVHIDRFKCFEPYVQDCYDVYKLLLSRHNDVFSDQFFSACLQSMSIPGALNKRLYFYREIQHLDWDSIIKDDRFKRWETKEDNRAFFLSALYETKDSYLIRKHNKYEIYVAPILCDGFHAVNILYIDELIKAIKKGNDAVYLLLHDNDLYTEGRNCHRVTVSDSGLGITETDLKDNYPQLLELILNKRVFVFKHDMASDDFYRRIVLKLGDDQESKLDDIIALLDNYKNYNLADKLAGELKKSDIKLLLNKALHTNGVYDFSFPFLKQ